MIDARVIQRILKIFSESVACLNFGVQPNSPACTVDCCPDSIVASRNETGLRSRFNDSLLDAVSEQRDRPFSKKGVACSLLTSMEAWAQAEQPQELIRSPGLP